MINTSFRCFLCRWKHFFYYLTLTTRVSGIIFIRYRWSDCNFPACQHSYKACWHNKYECQHIYFACWIFWLQNKLHTKGKSIHHINQWFNFNFFVYIFTCYAFVANRDLKNNVDTERKRGCHILKNPDKPTSLIINPRCFKK